MPDAAPSLYLKHVLVQRYGRLEQVSVGPFAPGLNVVQGPGEGGRQVLSSFIAGVLFGWPAADAMLGAGADGLEGAGRLVFSAAPGGDVVVAAGEEPGATAEARALHGGVDAATYARVFRLRADGLARLDHVAQANGLLLHAGADAWELPHAVLAAVEAEIAGLTRPAGGPEESLPGITARLDAVEEELEQVRERIRQRIVQYRECRAAGAEAPVESAPSVESRRFSALKQQRATLRTQLKDGRRRLSQLLLARDGLQVALEQWDAGQGGRILRAAGLLLEDMTGGAWQAVRIVDGVVLALDSQGDAREPRLMDVALRQQVHVALQLAVLQANGALGAGLPVLADDLLAPCVPEAREPVARALAQVARSRQVVVFCADDAAASLLRATGMPVNVVRL